MKQSIENTMLISYKAEGGMHNFLPHCMVIAYFIYIFSLNNLCWEFIYQCVAKKQ